MILAVITEIHVYGTNHLYFCLFSGPCITGGMLEGGGGGGVYIWWCLYIKK